VGRGFGRAYPFAHDKQPFGIPRMMNPDDREHLERERHRQLLDEFLNDATHDIEGMRVLVPRLESGDEAAWSRARNIAHNLGARAMALKLAVLLACLRELQLLTDERLNGAPLDDFFMQCVSSAIETLALEVSTLRRV
jgi:hypothetical protein